MKIDFSVAAIVTGGASGLGAATARALAARGAKVALFDLQAEKGQSLAEEIGGLLCEVDITNDASVLAGLEKARSIHGQERILVNCAGKGNTRKIAGRTKEDGSISHCPADVFQQIVDINLVGTFRCIAMSVAGMMTLDAVGDDGERGAIVNTASIAAEDGQMGQVSYSASKAGVIGMTLPLARDLMREGIRVNTILPGVFETPMMANVRDQVRDALAATIPFPKRFGQPDEYAQLALSIIENSYINGEDIRLDGAVRMGPR